MTRSLSPVGRIRRHPWLLALLVLVVLAAAPVGFAFVVGQNPPDWLPTPLAHFAFDVRLATAPAMKKAISLTRGSPFDKRVHLARGGENISLAGRDVELVGTLYDPPRRGPPASALPARPAVLLLHGSTPEGRRMGLYRVVAEALADRGYTVLSIDQRGFGASGRPDDVARADAWDYSTDVHHATAWLAGQPGVDRTGVHVVGHSFGAGVALTAGLSDSLTASIAILGPPAPGPFSEPGSSISPGTAGSPEPEVEGPQPRPRLTYMARRAQRYASMVTVPGISYTGTPEPLELLIAPGQPLGAPDHAPVLVVSSEYEPAHEVADLSAWQQQIAGPSRMLIVDRADHYFNTAGFGAVVIYDVRALAALVAELDGWLGGAPDGCTAGGECSWPGIPLVSLAAVLLLTTLALLVGILVRMRHGGAGARSGAAPRSRTVR